jgi:hypothetical protein
MRRRLGVGLLLLGLLTPARGEAAIALVSGNVLHSEADAAGTTLTTAAFTNNITTGNLLVVAVSWGSGATTDATVADSAGNTYVRTEAGPTYDAAKGAAGTLYYTVVTVGGGTKPTVTASFWTTTAHSVSSSQSYRVVLAAEFSGAATTTPLDKHGTRLMAEQAGGTNNYLCPAATVLPASDGQLILGFSLQDGGGSGESANWVAGTGYTETTRAVTVSPANYFYQMEHKVQTTATAVQTTWSNSTGSGSDNYFLMMATFAAASGASPAATRGLLLGVYP